jgi:hypothetical protein
VPTKSHAGVVPVYFDDIINLPPHVFVSFFVPDNDGVDDNSGETQLMNLGKLLESNEAVTSSSADDDDDKLSGGAIFGIVIACIAGVLLLLSIYVIVKGHVDRARGKQSSGEKKHLDEPTEHEEQVA